MMSRVWWCLVLAGLSGSGSRGQQGTSCLHFGLTGSCTVGQSAQVYVCGVVRVCMFMCVCEHLTDQTVTLPWYVYPALTLQRNINSLLLHT